MGDDINAALSDAFRILTRSQKSSSELKRILTTKGHKDGVIEKTIARLKSLHYLDDFEYALDWGRRRIKRYPIGIGLMQLELENKGIEREIIGGVIDIIYKENNEKDMASNLMLQKLALNRKPPLKKKPWVISLLQRRGFSHEVIQEIIEEIKDED